MSDRQRYIVQEVMSVTDGYGFNIVDERKRPIVTFSYPDRDAAEEARDFINAALIKASSVHPHGK